DSPETPGPECFSLISRSTPKSCQRRTVAKRNKADFATLSRPVVHRLAALAIAGAISMVLGAPPVVRAQSILAPGASGNSLEAGAPAPSAGSEGTAVEDFDRGPDAIHVSGGVPGAVASPADSSAAASAQAPRVPPAVAPLPATAVSSAPMPDTSASQASPAAQSSPAMASVNGAETSAPPTAPEAASSPTPVPEVRIEP